MLLQLTTALLLLAAFPVMGQEKKNDEKPVDNTEKKEDKLAPAVLGKPATDFTLNDVDGKAVKLSDFKGKIVVLEWFDQECPYCQYAYGETGPLAELPERMKKQGVVWLTLHSGASAKPEAMKKFAQEKKLTAPMLIDADGKVGTAYGAKRTPHCYVIDEKGVLRYRGALDNAPMGKVSDKETKTNYVESAVNALKGGKAVTTQDTKPYGCPIKYVKS